MTTHFKVGDIIRLVREDFWTINMGFKKNGVYVIEKILPETVPFCYVEGINAGIRLSRFVIAINNKGKVLNHERN